ncbi:LPS-assembly lipoprotein [Pseudomonas pohangensis]|uniref:LPS-assembly lipoprotein LptE n=1 Tax=Pseudomonas pohangensis TaxID=364197 RepID=A0A1H2H962_9PSED|nr:LPS assembly lipoprotein LptE [Pseudomonas pohangensis]SDU28352.1 LPS-assembly lipoprotein [Pseudomonas pohangensis]
MIKRNLLLIGLSALISACGFQLRGTGDMHFALQELGLTARNAYGETVKLTRKGLESSGVTVTETAPYTLALIREEQTSRTVSYTSSAQGAESEITKTLEYAILGKNNQTLMSNQLEVQRSYITDSNNIAGASESQIQLSGEMTSAMVQQLLGRIQMITPAQLDALQAKADADAKAAAEAAEAARKADEALQQQVTPIELPGIPLPLQGE